MNIDNKREVVKVNPDAVQGDVDLLKEPQ